MSQTKAQLLDNIKDNVQLDAQKALRFADSDSSHYVAFRAPGTVSSSVTWTLPAADGSANYVLATDGSGTLSWIADPAGQWTTSGSNIYFTGGNVGIGDSSPSNPLSVTGASAFNGDVQFTGASYNVTWDKSADDLIFNDNAKACFGTGSDLQIYHDGSHSQVKDAGSGGLHFWSGDYRFYNAAGSEYLLRATENGAVELYYDNVKRLETIATGVVITGADNGDAGVKGDFKFFQADGTLKSMWDASVPALEFLDDVKATFGSGDDLQIYHDGTNNEIRSNGAKDIYIRPKDTDVGVKVIADGGVELYYDNSKKFHTNAGGCQVFGNLFNGDNTHHYFGDGNDLDIYHDGSHSRIKNTTGYLILQSSTGILLKNDTDDENFIVANDDGSVELCHDGTKKLETTSTGIDIPDTLRLSTSYSDFGSQLCLGADSSGNCYIAGYNLIIQTGNNDARVSRFSYGHDNFSPITNNVYDLGTTSLRWRNIYSTQIGTNSSKSSRMYSSYFVHRDGSSGGVSQNEQEAIFMGGGLHFFHDNVVCSSASFSHGFTANRSYPTILVHQDGSGAAIHAEDGAITEASDYRIKENITTLGSAIDKVKTLKPITYTLKKSWKPNGKGEVYHGFVAHEVTASLPGITGIVCGEKDAMAPELYDTQDEIDGKIPSGKQVGDETGTMTTDMLIQGVDYGKLTPVLTAALKEAIAKIETLETKVAALESA